MLRQSGKGGGAMYFDPVTFAKAVFRIVDPDPKGETMNRCKTCTHWTPVNPTEWGALRGAGECTAVRAMHDVTERREDDQGEHLALEPEHAALLAVVADGSGYKAELITMPDFGCVQHEAA